MTLWFSIGTILLGAIGFYISEKIILMKKKNAPITCPVGYDCDEVIRGPYSTFFGIPTVNIGRIYYLATIVFYLTFLFVELPRSLSISFLLLAGLALAFSVYLTALQLFVIKKWCSWCLFSALVNLLLFVVVFVSHSTEFASFIFGYQHILQWVFVAFTILGTIITTLHAFTFVKFLRDFEISRKEQRRLKMYSHTAWVAIVFTFLSGLGITLFDTYGDFTGNSEFLVIGIIIGVTAVYELVHNTLLASRLVDVHFGDQPAFDGHEHMYQRKVSFALISLGVSSWYLLMLFAFLSWHEYSPASLVGIYILIILFAVTVGLRVERVIYKRSMLVK